MSVPIAWVHHNRRADARRGERCAKCGVHQRKAKLTATEAGWYCRAHERQLSPHIARHDDHDEDDEQ